MKGQKRDKSEFVTKFVGIIVTFISYKYFSEIPCKIFPTHLKHKTLNTTCIAPPTNPHQLYTY